MSNRDMAPGLTRALAAQDDPTAVALPPGACSVRGVEGVPSLSSVTVSARTRLGPLARLPRLRYLSIDGRGRRHHQPPRWRDRVRLQPLARAPALEHLMLYAIEEAIDGGAVLSQIPTLRTLEICHSRCPDLSGLAASNLERLDLDGVQGLRPQQLAGLRVTQLDLWGCGLDDIEVISTMPSIREVWLHGSRVPSLGPLRHLEAGARVYLDGSVDPEAHRAEIAALEERGVWLLICDEPHEHGFSPSWWTTSFPETAAGGIRYQSAGTAVR